MCDSILRGCRLSIGRIADDQKYSIKWEFFLRNKFILDLKYRNGLSMMSA